MKELDKIEELISQMEEITEREDTILYEDEKKLQNLYCEVKESLENIGVVSNDIKKINSFKKRFKSVCQEFENDDDKLDSSYEMMFPNGDDD